MRRFVFVLLIASAAAAQQAAVRPAASTPSLPPCAMENPTIVVKILSPLSSATANPGDAFTTSVDSPDALKGAIVEGRIAAVHRSEKGFGKAKASLQMEFTTMVMSGRSCALTAQSSDVTNSKGVANVDDEGQAIGRNSNKKRALATAGGALGGALFGALKGGVGGAVAGGVAGGAAGFILSSTLSSTASNIEFKPGSLFTLKLSDSSGARSAHRVH